MCASIRDYLSPMPANNDDGGFACVIGGAAHAKKRRRTRKRSRRSRGDDAHAAYDTETKNVGTVSRSKRSREEAEELRARLESAGLMRRSKDNPVRKKPFAQKPPETQTGAAERATSAYFSAANLPSREVSLRRPVDRSFSSSAPVAFASDDEKARRCVSTIGHIADASKCLQICADR